MRHVAGAVELQDRQIALFVGQQHRGGIFAPVIEHDADVGRLADDVVIRHHDAIVRQDHPGAQRVLHPWLALAELAEKFAKERILGKGAAPGLDHPAGIDIDHSGSGLADQWRKAERDLGAALGHAGLGQGRAGQQG